VHGGLAEFSEMAEVHSGLAELSGMAEVHGGLAELNGMAEVHGDLAELSGMAEVHGLQFVGRWRNDDRLRFHFHILGSYSLRLDYLCFQASFVVVVSSSDNCNTTAIVDIRSLLQHLGSGESKISKFQYLVSE
jgi:hypothetical protein